MKERLGEYKKKRNFSVTSEPKGEGEKSNAGRLRFAVQYHAASRLHYDLRLEWNGALLSWAVPKGPSYNPADKRLAVKVEDHPTEYADFEGNIPKGEYGGGEVMLWDEGVYLPLEDFDTGLKNGSLKFLLCGRRLEGGWTLVKMKGDGKDGDNWLLIKEKDEFAKDSDGISQYKTSVRTGRTHAQIAAEKSAKKASDAKKDATKNPDIPLEAQLCKQVDEVPDGDDRLYEIKYDGYRILAVTEGGEAKLYTRNRTDYTEKFAAVAQSLSDWAKERAMILDGEMAVADERGKTDFQALQAYLKKPKGTPTFIVFDALALDGKDLRDKPLSERKQILSELLKDPPDGVRQSSYVIGRGRESAEAARRLGLEGVVGKRLNSTYGGGRKDDWIKYKCYNRQEFVLGGYTRTENKPTGISALLLGVYREGAKRGYLQYAGRAGTGLDRKGESELLKLFSEYAADESPFADPPRKTGGEKIFWLSPELVGEVQFAEWTKSNRLRQASFKGLRHDKNAEDVTQMPSTAAKDKAVKSQPKKNPPKKGGTKSAEKKKSTREDGVSVAGVKITHPEKIVYPSLGVTKLDVIRYYEAAAERMLKIAAGRVLSVVRCHGGVGGECFFNKHPSAASKSKPVAVKSGDGEKTYFYVDDVAGLISEAQLGGLEFHVWGSRVSNLERPDMMVFDFDPDEKLDISLLREGVRGLKTTLDSLKLKSYLKTSGGKGYHVVVPFAAPMTWDKFREFSRIVAVHMASESPLYTSNIRKVRRQGKIFVDWGRNTRGATSVAPYSLRARPGAKVSMPIDWRELDEVRPDGIDIFEALERLRSPDPWRDF